MHYFNLTTEEEFKSHDNNLRDIIKNDLLDHNCFIFGSEIYKREFRNDSTNDIDVACPPNETNGYRNKIVNHLLDKYNCQLLHELSIVSHLKCDEIEIEIYDDELVKKILSTSPEQFRLIKTKDGIRYIDDNENITNDKTIISQIINRIKSNVILRSDYAKLKKPKHINYFKTWNKL